MRAPATTGVAGLAIAAPIAVAGDWSLAEFCWSTWLAGLLLSWVCVITGGVQIVLTAPRWRELLQDRLPQLRRLSTPMLMVITVIGALVVTGIAFRAYTFAYGFYGLFLSFFAEMEPHALFGRNGFINSDFWTPVQHLALAYWGMAAGTLVAQGGRILRADPWRRMLLPFGTELVRVHVMIVVLPFLALIAWAAVGDAYQPFVIVALMAVFYLLPRATRRENWRESECTV